MNSEKLIKKYNGSVLSGSHASFLEYNTTSTGILALDYALGTGGWRTKTCIEVYGARDIGKSSIIGFSAIKAQQRKGNEAVLIDVEGSFDPVWAEANGVDNDNLLVGSTLSAEDNFHLLHEMIAKEDSELFIFDSVGSLLRESEVKDGGKMAQGGQAGLITWGAKKANKLAKIHNKTVIFINQIRDNMDSMYGGVKPPGGHGIEHECSVIIQLKQGSDRYYVKRHDGKKSYDLQVGQEIIATFDRSKQTQGSRTRASFIFYNMESEKGSLGIDMMEDVIRTATLSGVFTRRGSIYDYDGHSFKGQNGVKEWLESDPKAYDKLRDDIVNSKGGTFEVEEETEDAVADES